MKNPLHFLKKKNKKESGITAHSGSAVASHVEAAERPGRTPRLKKPIKPDAYYGRLSAVSRVMQYAVMFVLILFAAGMPFLFRDEITAENFGLLLRNISFSFPGEQVEFTTVRYDADLAMDFAAYKEYFAVATTEGVRLYDHRGHIALDEELKMSDPVLDAGDRYVMAYDREGYGFAVYNSISLLYTGKEESAIHLADLCDEGSFLTVTASSMHKSVIKVYNRAFNLQRELKIDRYPLLARLSPDGETLLYLSYDTTEQGRAQGYVSIYDLKDKTTLSLEIRHGSLPLYGTVFNGGAAVVFEDGVCLYDKDEGEKQICSFEQGVPCRVSASERMLALAFEENGVTGRYSLMLLPLKEGASPSSQAYEGRIRALYVCESTVWITDDDALEVFDEETGNRSSYKGTKPMKIVYSEDGTVFACYANKAEKVAKVHIEEAEGKTEEQNPSVLPEEEAQTSLLKSLRNHQ